MREDVINKMFPYCLLAQEFQNVMANDINVIIKHVKELLRSRLEEKQINLQLQCDEPYVFLYCDENQLTQVFLNLIINAIQHIDRQGSIVIYIQRVNDFIEIKICDDGPGVSDNKKQKVFDPFYTQRKEGIGLGLTVVEQTVLAHSGHIFITDNSPKGACFHVQLPIENQDQK